MLRTLESSQLPRKLFQCERERAGAERRNKQSPAPDTTRGSHSVVTRAFTLFSRILLHFEPYTGELLLGARERAEWRNHTPL
ncbi:hypothetical protein SKAU_G00024800 [Synaphobranchus kaupii]|uniref:Uncharacterized protein n=1 Tax=Synaphobranchus kaupii TaxID=118154 RepID=A0A9Q1JEU3_SYNKA|nr:hypothetical protein SKAU_G00024800 [Synaphobranchus kaupii]